MCTSVYLFLSLSMPLKPIPPPSFLPSLPSSLLSLFHTKSRHYSSDFFGLALIEHVTSCRVWDVARHSERHAEAEAGRRAEGTTTVRVTNAPHNQRARPEL